MVKNPTTSQFIIIVDLLIAGDVVVIVVPSFNRA